MDENQQDATQEQPQEQAQEQVQQEEEPKLFVEEQREQAQQEAPAEEKAEPEQQGRLSEAMERLSQKDREVQAARGKLKELEKLDQLKEQKNPDEILRAFGLDPVEYIYGKMLEEDVPQEKKKENETNQKIEELQSRLATFEEAKKKEELNTRYSEQVNNINQLADSLKGDLPLVAKEVKRGGPKFAAQVIQACSNYYQQTGQVPDLTEMLKNAENVLETEFESAYKAYSEVDKIRNKIGIGKPAAAPKAKTNTLTSAAAGQVMPADEGELSDEDGDAMFLRQAKSFWREDDE